MSVQSDAVEWAGGAPPAPFAGSEPVARFTDVSREWAAVRRRCGLLDARFRALLRVTGGDRVSFLQGMVSNDVAALRDGQGTYAALLTTQGKVVADLRVYALPEEMWLDVPATRAEAVRDALGRYIVADDVEFVADELWRPLVALEGPHAARTLLAVAGAALEALEPFAHRELSVDGRRVRVAAVTHGGESGFLLFGAPAGAASLWEHCAAAGAEPVGMEALNVLRLEAGIPWYGHDMDESTLISEVGLEAAISYQKGCYLGQEVVERVAARGQVHRKLVGLACDGPTAPAPGSRLLHAGKEAGVITSAVWSPARAAVIALGYVRRECWDPGCELQLTAAEGTAVARVVTLPFYSTVQGA